MRTIAALFFLWLIYLPAAAQKSIPDSLRELQQAYNKEKKDTSKVVFLLKMSDLYSRSQPDSELFKAQQALLISRRIKFKKGELLSLKNMAEAYQLMSNYPLALQYYLQRLQLDEKNPNPEREVVTLLSIANLYETEEDYKQALPYAQQAFELIEKNKLEEYRWYSYIGFGDLYLKIGDIEKAKQYNERAYEVAMKKNTGRWLGMTLNNMGNTFLKDKEYAQASDYYHRGIPYLKQDQNNSFLCETYQGLATILFESGHKDSAVYYAKEALQLARTSNLDNYYLQVCGLLSGFYKRSHKADSALVYQDRVLQMKDSIYSQEKVKQIENLTLSEKLRQEERRQEQIQEANDRTYKMKMLLIGILIPFFFLASVILSRRRIKRQVVEFSGIVSLLLVFEYLTLWLHPIISDATHHSPFMEIIILVIIAAILTPTHHRLEHWMMHQLTHKLPEKHDANTVAIIADEKTSPPDNEERRQ